MKIRKVVWMDAVSKTLSKETINSLDKSDSGKDLLAINTTYGICHELKDVLVITTEESTISDSDVTIIPKDWVISPKFK